MKTYFVLILCVLFWSGNFILARFMKDSIEPLELAFLRWFFVFLFISPYLFIHRKKLFTYIKAYFVSLLILSILSVSAFNTLLYYGLQTTTATNALIINSVTPIMVIIFAYFILKQDITKRQSIGIFLSLFGVIYLILEGSIQTALALEFNEGDIWIIISSLTWALYSVVLKFKPGEIQGFDFFAILVVLGLLILFPLYLSQGYTLESQIILIENNFMIFIYVSIFASILSYYFWNHGIEKIGASKTSQFTHLMPLFGSFLAYIFLDESLQYFHIVGMALIFLGIYLSLFQKERKL